MNEIVTTVKARCEAIKANDKSAMELADDGFTFRHLSFKPFHKRGC